MSELDRNLRPHAEAVAARWLFRQQYVRQNCGVMDFWLTLRPYEKRMCREFVDEVMKAPLGRAKDVKEAP